MDLHDRVRAWWDEDAPTYDGSTTHAVSDPVEAAAWRAALQRALPEPPASILDAGTGTGSLALLAAELGHTVTGLDLSEAMLARARRKAEERGIAIGLVRGAATEPPAGPFDVVMERHVLWTLPDPVEALRAWRSVAGRLLVFEGIWGSTAPLQRAKDLLAQQVRTAMRIPPDHHAPYPDEVIAQLPLVRMPSPEPLIAAIFEAGWKAVRIQRLRDVEWASRLREPWPLGWLEDLPRYALVADA